MLPDVLVAGRAWPNLDAARPVALILRRHVHMCDHLAAAFVQASRFPSQSQTMPLEK
jgi:hypothetical protein